MSEWWTYRPSDFLLFSARTYRRLFELLNDDLWPAQLVAVLAAVLVFALLRGGGLGRGRPVFALVAAAWLCSAWAFFWQRYAGINWAAPGFAAAFLLEGALLLALAITGRGAGLRRPGDIRSKVARALLLAAIVYPLIGLALGRPPIQAEVIGLAPDPTAIGTLGLLLACRWDESRLPRSARTSFAVLLWAIPAAWCLVTGLTLWTLQAPEAIIAPAAALLALGAARLSPTSSSSPTPHAADR